MTSLLLYHIGLKGAIFVHITPIFAPLELEHFFLLLVRLSVKSPRDSLGADRFLRRHRHRVVIIIIICSPHTLIYIRLKGAFFVLVECLRALLTELALKGILVK